MARATDESPQIRYVELMAQGRMYYRLLISCQGSARDVQYPSRKTQAQQCWKLARFEVTRRCRQAMEEI